MKRKQPLSKILSDYQPHPGKNFYQRMAAAPWNNKDTKMTDHSRRPARFGWQISLALFLVIIVLALSVPSVRAAISDWLGLSVAPANQMPAAPLTLVAITLPAPSATPLPASTATSTTPIETAPPQATDQAANQAAPAEIGQLTIQAGWDILTARQLPPGYKYQSAYFDTSHQMVILTYLVTRALPDQNDPSLTASKTVTLLQAEKNDFVPMQVAPSSNVADVQVNGEAAAYIIGAWDAQFVKDDTDPNGGKMVYTWRNDLKVQNLYWQVGKLFLVLVTDDDAVSKQELLDMANSVTK
jgi:hypothetical protein